MNYFKKCNNWVGWAVFALAAVVYLLTMEPTGSLWDCMEFIATSYKLEVGHPPGAPLFMMISRLFTLFSFGNPSYAAAMVNAMSSLASAFCILFLFWTITHLARKMFGKGYDLSRAQTWTVIGAGVIGAVAYTFTDTFWFSAIEGEVYALSSMFTALVVWAMLKWEDVADEPHANRWLVLIAYLMGLSIGVHILNLLTIPALVFIYYFRTTERVTGWGVVKAILAACAILLAINSLIIPYTVAIGAAFDKVFVNSLGLPINSGLLFFVVALFVALGWAVWYTYKKGKVVANTIILCLTVVLLGYGSYASVVIRAAVNPPMNSNDPDNPYSLLSLLNRDQYGNRPLFYGAPYTAPIIDYEWGTVTFVGDDGKYKTEPSISGYVYPPGFQQFFPRMYSSLKAQGYEDWVDVKGRTVRLGNQAFKVPTFGENLKFFFSYQLNFMYWRYFLWNFVGRQSNNQSTGEITDGNWLSGIPFIDEIYLGPQDNLPSEMAANKGRNTYYFLPFILGVLGLIYQLSRDKRNFTVVLWLFVMMGIALVFYFNTAPSEPRERDYVYAGSFYAFCIWIGFGVIWIQEILARLFKRDNVASALVATLICSCVPIILAAENWDDHDRSHRYAGRDLGYDYLQSTLPNSIIMNYGDNDTFPLWYNQEVEGVRKDVRVMNMSYLTGEWYIDEMKYRINESDPVPFSFPRRVYTNRNESIGVEERNGGKPLDIRTAIEFVKSEDPVTRRPDYDGNPQDFIPAKVLAVPVNKENVIASGIVRPEDADLILDTIYVKISGSHINRGELMLLDLLANFDWKRPLYFTQPHSLASLGLRDYLQLDGIAYRLVPIRTPYTDFTSVGRIDTDYLYDKLMNVFKYGNVKDPRVYVDNFVQINFRSAMFRNAFARLAKALVAEGDTVRAVEVLDRSMEELPYSQFVHSYFTLPIVEAYYAAGEIEKGDALLEDYVSKQEEFVDYYLRFTGRKEKLVDQELAERVDNIYRSYQVARMYGRNEFVYRIYDFLGGKGMVE